VLAFDGKVAIGYVTISPGECWSTIKGHFCRQ